MYTIKILHTIVRLSHTHLAQLGVHTTSVISFILPVKQRAELSTYLRRDLLVGVLAALFLALLPNFMQHAQADSQTQSTAAPLAGEKTLIVLNYAQMISDHGLNAVMPLVTKLNALAAHPAVDGTVLLISEDPTFNNLHNLWINDPASVSFANATASAAHDFIGRKRTNRTEYIVLIGGDYHIPYRRVDDKLDPPPVRYDKVPLGTPLGSAFLERQILTDDFYADPRALTQDPPYEPKLGVGRLVETPTEIEAALDQFLASDGRLIVENALAAAYGPMVDAAATSCDLLQWDAIEADCELNNDGWLPQQLRAKLTDDGLPSLLMPYVRADHGSLNVGLGSASDALAADATSAWTVPISGTLVYYPVSNHAGLNVAADGTPPFDWAQAWVGRGAVFIGNTSNGIVSGDGVLFSEKLGQYFVEEVVDGETIAVASALNEAKARYRSEILQSGESFSEIDQKVVAETVLYGLPMTQLVSPVGDTFEQAGDNDCAQAQPIALGETQRHSFHERGDVDWLQVLVEAGDSLLVSLAEQGDSFAEATIYADCEATTASLLATGNVAQWDVLEGGTYMIQVRSTFSGIHGPGVGYTLNIDSGINYLLPLIGNNAQ